MRYQPGGQDCRSRNLENYFTLAALEIPLASILPNKVVIWFAQLVESICTDLQAIALAARDNRPAVTVQRSILDLPENTDDIQSMMLKGAGLATHQLWNADLLNCF